MIMDCRTDQKMLFCVSISYIKKALMHTVDFGHVILHLLVYVKGDIGIN